VFSIRGRSGAPPLSGTTRPASSKPHASLDRDILLGEIAGGKQISFEEMPLRTLRFGHSPRVEIRELFEPFPQIAQLSQATRRPKPDH
jgi:hypothetical protein